MTSLSCTFLGTALIEYDPRRYIEEPLADILPLLTNQDLVMTNFEGAVCASDNCERTRHDEYFHGTDPSVLDYLDHIGVNVLSLANNHAWDYGNDGILATLQIAHQHSFLTAGIGATLQAAAQPNFITIQDVRVALIAAVTLDDADTANATPTKPGIHRVYTHNSTDFERTMTHIQHARTQADLVIVQHHIHHQQQPDDVSWQQMFAHAAIDAGASIYLAHGEPVISGVEIYNDSPIFYGMGNFIFHTRAPIGKYPPPVWEGIIYQVDFTDNTFGTMTLTPIALNEGTPGTYFLQKRGYPSRAHGEQAQSILHRLRNLSLPFGTNLTVNATTATIEMNASP